MPDVHDYRDAIHDAERAAAAGDFSRAETALRQALDLQEREFGAAHPELASTLNNLAVVCETNGRIDDAEQLYRRAYAVASGSLPPGDALIATSRANLEDFCRAHGRAIEDWPELGQTKRAAGPARPAVAPARTSGAAAPAAASPNPMATTSAATPQASPTEPSKPPTAVIASTSRGGVRHDAHAASAVRAPRGPTTPDASGLPRGFVAALTALAIGGTLAIAWFALAPASPSGAAGTPAPADAARASTAARSATTADPSAAVATPEPVTPAPATAEPAPLEPAPSPRAAPANAPPPPVERTAEPPAPPPTEPASAAAAPADERRSVADAGGGAERLVAANLCQPLVRRGRQWTCESPGDAASPGPVAFYTRIASPRPVRVEHRWFRDGALTRTVNLSVGASPSEGYRTYSQQTVRSGRWRVELRTADGRVLHDTSFDVR